MKRTFIEMSAVTRLFNATGVADEDLRNLQREIMNGAGDMIKDTGGYKKIRCAAAGRGKSGALRVIFADYPLSGYCILVTAFAKNVQGNLNKSERNQLKKVKAVLDQRYAVR